MKKSSERSSITGGARGISHSRPAAAMFPNTMTPIVEIFEIQSYQANLWVRFMAFGNDTLQALYDRSPGFFRRQLILEAKEQDPNRKNDPYLAEKLCAEKEGIANIRKRDKTILESTMYSVGLYKDGKHLCDIIFHKPSLSYALTGRHSCLVKTGIKDWRGSLHLKWWCICLCEYCSDSRYLRADLI